MASPSHALSSFQSNHMHRHTTHRTLYTLHTPPYTLHWLGNDSETKDDSATKTGWFWNQNRWFCNQEWFWNQKKWFWNQGWFCNQGHMETKTPWFSNESRYMPDVSKTPPHLETMPCWVWPQVCQRKERSCQDVIIPPHPTPPHPPASEDDAMLSVAASASEEGT